MQEVTALMVSSVVIEAQDLLDAESELKQMTQDQIKELREEPWAPSDEFYEEGEIEVFTPDGRTLKDEEE